MTSDWQTIDWDEDKPDARAIKTSHQMLRYAAIDPVRFRTPAIEELLAALAAVHTNGGVLLGGFEVVADDPAARWYAARNRFGEYGFFTHFLGSPAVRKTLPELDVPDRLDGLEFEPSWTNSLGLDGEWAATLVHGGAYESFPGSQSQAKQLGLAAVASLVGDRHADFRVFTSSEAWAGWFEDVAWDRTWLLVDKTHARLFLLAVTDTD